MPRVSVVVPVLDEVEGLPELQRRLDDALDGIPSEVVYVDDGSTDGSTELMTGWAQERDDVRVVVLSRNFGMEVAMSAGLDHADGAYAVLLHADLQDPPELIPEMLAIAERDGVDVVFARRIGRDEGALKRALATMFYTLMQRTSRVPYQGQAGDFRLMSRRVLDTLREMPERRRFLRGMVAWVGYEQVPIEYRRAGRVSGRGASYPALFRLALEGLIAFSDVPLYIATFLGILAAALALLGAVVLAVLAIAGVVTTSGWVWVLAAVLLLGGLQLISIGILGRYLARVHAEALHRPLYVVSRVVGQRTGA